MNEYLKQYIELQKQFRETEGDPDSVRALYTFKEKLELSEDKQAKEVLVDVYDLLDFKKDAYELLCQIGNRSDKKTLKRLGILKDYAENWGNHYALPKPKTPEEIVHGGIYCTGVDFCSTFAQFLHHFLLNLRGFCHHGFKPCFGHRQMKLVRCFNVRNLLEHGHQFREIEKLCKPGAGTIACTFGLDFVKRFSVIFLNSSGCPQGSPL